MPEAARGANGSSKPPNGSANATTNNPHPKDVLVLSLGSHALRYGRATDTTPRKLLSVVAFPRKAGATRPAVRPYRVPPPKPAHDFEQRCDHIARQLELDERRIGGGRPIPWEVEVEVEAVKDEQETPPPPTPINAKRVLVGREAAEVLDDARSKDYDVVAPFWDGKLVFGMTEAADTLVRAAVDALLAHIAHALRHDATNGTGAGGGGGGGGGEAAGGARARARHVALVIPDASDRRDIAEVIEAIFRCKPLEATAVFLHQSSVSCALGAGLATCTVVDIGHSATTVACVEDGAITTESRAHIRYGAHAMQVAFGTLLAARAQAAHAQLMQAQPRVNMRTLIARAAELLCTLRSDENDRLANAAVADAGSKVRLKCGLALRTLPAHGLLDPALLQAVMGATPPRHGPTHPHRTTPADHYLDRLHREIKRNAHATASVPIGTYYAPHDRPLVDAILHAAVAAARVSSSPTASPARFLTAVVLSGGGAALDGIAPALERRIKALANTEGVQLNDVTVIDGGKGKGDEELAAAAALLARRGAPDRVEQVTPDDTDTASLPWKGGAVMVEADAVKEYWISRREWTERTVRVLREKAPFYW